MAPMRVGLIGCGKVAHIHAAALRGIPEAELAAVCDVSAERIQAFAARYGARGYADVDVMLRESKVEAVVIGTPHPLHAAPAIRAMEKGVHVLVEKPLAANLADCDAMLTAAKRAGVLLSVISQRRFYEPVRRMKEAIDAGKLGRPALGVFTMYSWREPAYYQSDPWRLCAQKKLAHIRVGVGGRGTIRISAESLDAYIRDASVQPDEQPSATQPAMSLKHLNPARGTVGRRR